MSKIFTRSFRVRWSELDASGTVSPANYLRYLLETAWDWGVAIGWDADYSQNPDVLWLIREAKIRFLQLLRHNDEFDLTIWMVHWQRVRGTRCFELTHKATGDVIAQGTQQIVYIDAWTGRPINLPEQEIIRFRLDKPRIPFRALPKGNTAGKFLYHAAPGAHPIPFHGSLGRDAACSIHMPQRNETGGSRYVGIKHADGSTAAECFLDWGLVDRRSGEVRSLPQGLY